MPSSSMRFYDPEGSRYGIPTFPWRLAPDTLATLRQLAAAGLRPGGAAIAGQIMWRRAKGKVGVAYLYPVAAAVPKRPATPGNLRAVRAMLRARSTCRRCGTAFEYCLPSGRICLDCDA